MVPKTVPFKSVKAKASATQARLRGEKTGDEDRSLPVQTASLVNGATALVSGSGATPSRAEDDPSQQLELEMRHAARANRDGDVSMTG
jgi:DNA polymerase epsilon subunit 4